MVFAGPHSERDAGESLARRREIEFDRSAFESEIGARRHAGDERDVVRLRR